MHAGANRINGGDLSENGEMEIGNGDGVSPVTKSKPWFRQGSCVVHVDKSAYDLFQCWLWVCLTPYSLPV
jgi:hypothetical protein